MAQGRAAAATGHFDLAIQAFRSAHSARDWRPEPLQELASAYRQSRALDLALRTYAEIPTPTSRDALAALLFEEGERTVEAAAYFARSHYLQPTRGMAKRPETRGLCATLAAPLSFSRPERYASYRSLVDAVTHSGARLSRAAPWAIGADAGSGDRANGRAGARHVEIVEAVVDVLGHTASFLVSDRGNGAVAAQQVCVGGHAENVCQAVQTCALVGRDPIHVTVQSSLHTQGLLVQDTSGRRCEDDRTHCQEDCVAAGESVDDLFFDDSLEELGEFSQIVDWPADEAEWLERHSLAPHETLVAGKGGVQVVGSDCSKWLPFTSRAKPQ
jgi:hypothetical protein